MDIFNTIHVVHRVLPGEGEGRRREGGGKRGGEERRRGEGEGKELGKREGRGKGESAGGEGGEQDLFPQGSEDYDTICWSRFFGLFWSKLCPKQLNGVDHPKDNLPWRKLSLSRGGHSHMHYINS